MSNEIKKRVLLASVLKPVDDTRMFEKIGATLAEEGYEVFVIGYPSNVQVVTPGITVLSLPRFNRTSLKRLFIPWIVYRKINAVKPGTIIINTPELLFVAALNRIFHKRQVIYDVLENYYRTIRFTSTYPRGIRVFVASVVRLTEFIMSRFVHKFFLAEKGYERELNFVNNPVVLENKLPRKVAERHATAQHQPYYNLLFSGTLAPSTGVFEAIKLSRELHAIDDRYRLTIIGYAAVPDVYQQIQSEIQHAGFIQLIGGGHLVAHADILREISKAGTGLILYPSNPGTESSIPTKLYEYLALRLPIVISHTGPSHELVTRYNAGVIWQPGMHAADLNRLLADSRFTFDCEDTVYWDSQAALLMTAITP